jgi:hypothetical protein
MTNLLTFLSALFYVPLAALIAVAIIEHLRVASRQTTELADEERLQQAA